MEVLLIPIRPDVSVWNNAFAAFRRQVESSPPIELKVKLDAANANVQLKQFVSDQKAAQAEQLAQLKASQAEQLVVTKGNMQQQLQAQRQAHQAQIQDAKLITQQQIANAKMASQETIAAQKIQFNEQRLMQQRQLSEQRMALRSTQTETNSVFSNIAGNINKHVDSISKAVYSASRLMTYYLGYQVMSAVGSSLGNAVASVSQFEQTRVSLDTLLKSSDQAKKTMKELWDFAAKTPFTMQDLSMAEKQLVGFGFSADDATKTLKELGDISAGVGAPIGDLAYLMGTLQVQGRAYTRDIVQFAQRGIPIYEYLSKVTGKYGKDLKQSIEDGEVGYPQVAKAFELMTDKGGLFFGLMEKQSHTLSGLISTLKDNFMAFVRSVFGISNEGDIAKGSIMDKLKVGTQNLIEWLGKNGPKAGEWINKELLPKINTLANAVLDFIDRHKEDFKKFFNDARDASKELRDALAPIAGQLLKFGDSLLTMFGKMSPEDRKFFFEFVGAYVLLKKTGVITIGIKVADWFSKALTAGTITVASEGMQTAADTMAAAAIGMQRAAAVMAGVPFIDKTATGPAGYKGRHTGEGGAHVAEKIPFIIPGLTTIGSLLAVGTAAAANIAGGAFYGAQKGAKATDPFTDTREREFLKHPTITGAVSTMVHGATERSPLGLAAFEITRGFKSGMFGDIGKWFMRDVAHPIGHWFSVSLPHFFEVAPGKIGKFFSNIGKDIARFFEGAGKTIEHSFDNVIKFFRELPGKILHFLAGFPKTMAKFWGEVVGYIILAYAGLIKFWIELPGKIIHFLSGLTRPARNWAEGLVKDIVHVLSNILNWFKELPGHAIQVISRLPGLLINMFHSIVQKVIQILTDVINWFKELPGRIIRFIIDVKDKFISNMIDLWHGSETILVNILDWFKALPDRIIAFIAELPNRVWSVISGITDFFRRVFSDAVAVARDAVNFIIGIINSFLDGINNVLGTNLQIGLVVEGASNSNLSSQAHGREGHADGGLIRGPGTGTSDSIKARLSDYEYVMPAHRVKELGVDFFEAIRKYGARIFGGDPHSGATVRIGISEPETGFAGGGIAEAKAFAEAQNHKPYIWASAGPDGYDCCLVGNTRVYGPNGAIQIRDIVPGDIVYSYVDGKLTSNIVTNAWQSKLQEVFSVRTRNRTVTGSANHPFMCLVQTKSGRGSSSAKFDVQWKRLDELQRGDLLVQPKQYNLNTESVYKLLDGTIIDSDVAWLIGAMTGDGTVTDKGIRLCMYGELREYATEIINNNWNSKVLHGEEYGLVTSNVNISRSLVALGMKVLGPEKRIPEAVWSWPIKLQRAYLDGYCDADGSYPLDQKKYGERKYDSSSIELINDVRALHIMLGDAVSNVHTKNRTKPIIIKGKQVKNAKPMHEVIIWLGNKGETVLRRNKGINNWLDSTEFTVTRILSIEEQGVADTWDIEVYGSHNFIADGIVVHNSGFMSAIYNVVKGNNPYQHTFSTSNEAGFFIPGAGNAHQFTVGWYNDNSQWGGHTAGVIDGLPVESGGALGDTHVGPGSTPLSAFSSLGHLEESAMTRETLQSLLDPIVNRLKSLLSGPELVKQIGDKTLDFIENHVLDVFNVGDWIAQHTGPIGRTVKRLINDVTPFDTGGPWADGVIGINTTGKTETVRTFEQEMALQHGFKLHPSTITRFAQAVAMAMQQVSLEMDGSIVSEKVSERVMSGIVLPGTATGGQ